MRKYDLVIVGAGPAGLALAESLSETNLKILLLDKKKNAEDVQYNTAISLIKPAEYCIPPSILNPVNKCRIASKNKYTIKETEGGFVINRKKLLKFLENKARKNPNIEIFYNSAIKEVKTKQNRTRYLTFTKRGKDFRASGKIYADCSGIGVVFGRKIGFDLKHTIAVGIGYVVPLKKSPHEIDLFVSAELRGGYGWVAPLDPQKTIIGYGTFSKRRFSKIEDYLKGMWKINRVKERCELKPLEKHTGILRTGKLPSKFVNNNVVLIGDSALQANPLVGEGIRFVMDSARIASKWIQQSIEKNDLDLLKNYEKEWNRKYYKKYKIALLIQEKMKKITEDDKKIDSLIKKLDKIPDKDFVRLLGGDLSYLFLFKIFLKSLMPKPKQKTPSLTSLKNKNPVTNVP